LTERLHYFVVGALDIGGERHVALDADHPPAVRPDGLDRMIERFASARDNGHIRARGCKPRGDGEPDALASPGDHRRPAGETDVHSYPPARAGTAGASLKSYSPRRAGKSGRDASPRVNRSSATAYGLEVAHEAPSSRMLRLDWSTTMEFTALFLAV